MIDEPRPAKAISDDSHRRSICCIQMRAVMHRRAILDVEEHSNNALRQNGHLCAIEVGEIGTFLVNFAAVMRVTVQVQCTQPDMK